MFADIGNVPAIVTKGDDRKDDGLFGGGYMWVFALVIIFLALVFLWGRNNQGGTSGAAEIAALSAINSRPTATSPDERAAFTEINGRFDALSQQVGHINDVNDLRDLKTTQAALNQNVTQQAFNLSTQVSTNRTDTLLNFKDLALQVAQGNCDINRNIDGVRFDGAQNTCNIISAMTAGIQRVIDNQTETEMARLRDELAREREARARENLVASQLTQTASIINAVRPYPQPSYGVLPPIPNTALV